MADQEKELQTSALDVIEQNQEKRKYKKQANFNVDDTVNTKLLSKNTGKKVDPNAQTKLTHYFNSVNNSSTNTDNKDQHQINHGVNENQIKIRELQQKMKEKDSLIQKMRRMRQHQQNRYSVLYTQNKMFKKKARDTIAKSMLEAAQLRRAERKQIDPRLGYFKDGLKNFIEGSILTDIKKKIKEKQQLIKQAQVDKKSKDLQKKERAVFRVQFLQKQINLLHKELLNKENQVNVYKQKLKLAQKQQTCQYSCEGWPIVFDQYQTLQLLGKGGFGQVYKCYDLQLNQIVALKVSKFKQDPQHQEQFIKHVTREAQVQKKLNHPNIAKIYRLIECSTSKVIFTLEYCSGPELSVYLKKHGCLEQKQAKIIIRQIISALNYLYSLKEKIIHYDLKPSNIMFHNGLIKILDFGLCKPMDSQQSRIQLTSQGVGTYWYLPPQTFNQSNPLITSKVDIWSVGVIFYQILYGKRPFGHGMSQNRIYTDGIILNATKVEFPVETPKKYKISQATKNFIKECLQYDMQKRLNPSQAYEHEYFKK